VTNFKNSTPTARPLRSRAAAVAAALGAAILIAGCGSSGGSSTITVGNENTADNSLIKAGESSSKSSASTANTKTPTTGPLSKEPVVTPPAGPAPTKLETKELIAGTGAEAKAGDTVVVNYVGVLYKGGKEFDASWKRHETFSFTLGKGQVIKGWDQGIVGMKVGGRRELVIPSELAYGKTGSPPTIPANAPLVFVVDLLGV
jgi:peptidylprolyl isomerase